MLIKLFLSSFFLFSISLFTFADESLNKLIQNFKESLPQRQAQLMAELIYEISGDHNTEKAWEKINSLKGILQQYDALDNSSDYYRLLKKFLHFSGQKKINDYQQKITSPHFKKEAPDFLPPTLPPDKKIFFPSDKEILVQKVTDVVGPAIMALHIIVNKSIPSPKYLREYSEHDLCVISRSLAKDLCYQGEKGNYLFLPFYKNFYAYTLFYLHHPWTWKFYHQTYTQKTSFIAKKIQSLKALDRWCGIHRHAVKGIKKQVEEEIKKISRIFYTEFNHGTADVNYYRNLYTREIASLSAQEQAEKLNLNLSKKIFNHHGTLFPFPLDFPYPLAPLKSSGKNSRTRRLGTTNTLVQKNYATAQFKFFFKNSILPIINRNLLLLNTLLAAIEHDQDFPQVFLGLSSFSQHILSSKFQHYLGGARVPRPQEIVNFCTHHYDLSTHSFLFNPQYINSLEENDTFKEITDKIAENYALNYPFALNEAREIANNYFNIFKSTKKLKDSERLSRNKKFNTLLQQSRLTFKEKLKKTFHQLLKSYSNNHLNHLIYAYPAHVAEILLDLSQGNAGKYFSVFKTITRQEKKWKQIKNTFEFLSDVAYVVGKYSSQPAAGILLGAVISTRLISKTLKYRNLLHHQKLLEDGTAIAGQGTTWRQMATAQNFAQEFATKAQHKLWALGEEIIDVPSLFLGMGHHLPSNLGGLWFKNLNETIARWGRKMRFFSPTLESALQDGAGQKYIWEALAMSSLSLYLWKTSRSTDPKNYLTSDENTWASVLFTLSIFSGSHTHQNIAKALRSFSDRFREIMGAIESGIHLGESFNSQVLKKEIAQCLEEIRSIYGDQYSRELKKLFAPISIDRHSEHNTAFFTLSQFIWDHHNKPGQDLEIQKYLQEIIANPPTEQKTSSHKATPPRSTTLPEVVITPPKKTSSHKEEHLSVSPEAFPQDIKKLTPLKISPSLVFPVKTSQKKTFVQDNHQKETLPKKYSQEESERDSFCQQYPLQEELFCKNHFLLPDFQFPITTENSFDFSWGSYSLREDVELSPRLQEFCILQEHASEENLIEVLCSTPKPSAYLIKYHHQKNNLLSIYTVDIFSRNTTENLSKEVPQNCTVIKSFFQDEHGKDYFTFYLTCLLSSEKNPPAATY